MLLCFVYNVNNLINDVTYISENVIAELWNEHTVSRYDFLLIRQCSNKQYLYVGFSRPVCIPLCSVQFPNVCFLSLNGRHVT